MTVCARVIGARQRLRLPARRVPVPARAAARRRCSAGATTGLLGNRILGEPGFDFDIDDPPRRRRLHLRRGVGADRVARGQARAARATGRRIPVTPRLPEPADRRQQRRDLRAARAKIAVRGGAWFAAIGTPQSTGTKLLSVSGDCARPGVYEYPFGVTVRAGARRLRRANARRRCRSAARPAPACRGASSTAASRSRTSPPPAPSWSSTRQRDMFEVARNFTHFFAHESCGFCTPCRVGTTLLSQAHGQARRRARAAPTT